jgi:hypothetical protein
MRFKTLLLIITIIIIFLPLLTTADAEQVQWSSIGYEASAFAKIWPGINSKDDYQESFGPPLPIDASAFVDRGVDPTYYYASSSSHVESSIIDIITEVEGCG